MLNWIQHEGDPADWDARIRALNGGFYQSHGWGEVRRVAGWSPLRLSAMGEAGEPVAAASVLVRRHMGIPVCWIPGGPVGPMTHFDGAFRSALARFVGSRLLYCRLNLLRRDEGGEASVLAGQGWKRPLRKMSSGLTMLYALDGDPAERMLRASGNWRHNLKRSGRHALRIEHWADPDPHEISALYREMEGLKSLAIQHTEDELGRMLEAMKTQIAVFRCLGDDGSLLAIRAAGLFGGTAWDLLAAAGIAARKVYASHATLWALLEHCRQAGMRHYDLSGVDPVANKGVYDFKQGTGAQLVECLGEWEWASLPGMRLGVNWALGRRAGA